MRKISKCISKRITLFMCVAMFGIAAVGCGASEEDKKDVKDIVADDGDNGGENAESEKRVIILRKNLNHQQQKQLLKSRW